MVEVGRVQGPSEAREATKNERSGPARSMARTSSGRTAALALAGLLVLGSGVAHAGNGGGGNPLEGSAIQTCGHWILKLRDFGKQKLNDYNQYVPENFETTPDPIRPVVTFSFGADTFVMIIQYPNNFGVTLTRLVNGTYAQNGRKLKFRLDPVGVTALEGVFSELAEFTLLGKRELITDVTFAQLRSPNKMKFKGRVKGNGIKVKFKGKMLYDIQFEDGSEYPDAFDAAGRFKLRATTKNCPGPG